MPLRVSKSAYVTSLVVLAVSAIAFGAGIKAAGVYLQKLPIYPAGDRKTDKIPAETPTWISAGPDIREPPEIEEVLGTKNYVSRAYFKKIDPTDKSKGLDHSAHLAVHVAYYTGQIDTVPHVPDRCMVGAGMDMVSSGIMVPLTLSRQGWIEDSTVPNDLKGKIFTARTIELGNRVRLPQGLENVKLRVSEFTDKKGVHNFAGFFFIANGTVVSTPEEVRTLSFDLKADYAYYCKVQFNSSLVKSPEQLGELASSFLSEMMPEIARCVPDWVEVQKGEYPADNPHKKKPNP